MIATSPFPWVAELSFGKQDTVWVGPVYPAIDTHEAAAEAIREAARHTFDHPPMILRLHRGDLVVLLDAPAAPVNSLPTRGETHDHRTA
jgi:hypothetical protein